MKIKSLAVLARKYWENAQLIDKLNKQQEILKPSLTSRLNYAGPVYAGKFKIQKLPFPETKVAAYTRPAYDVLLVRKEDKPK